MVTYYARRGDMYRARETFESMRARGIEPTSHVYTRYQLGFNILCSTLNVFAKHVNLANFEFLYFLS
jgi:pentatricopeptide repeat protein